MAKRLSQVLERISKVQAASDQQHDSSHSSRSVTKDVSDLCSATFTVEEKTNAGIGTRSG